MEHWETPFNKHNKEVHRYSHITPQYLPPQYYTQGTTMKSSYVKLTENHDGIHYG